MKITHIFFIVILSLAPHSVIADETKTEKGVGFKKVADALAFLKTKESVSFAVTKPDGWVIANESSPFTVWSFTPEDHYAHPAVVKRELKKNENGMVAIEMTALCEATKAACDKLINEFKAMNNKAAENVQNNINKYRYKPN